MSKKFFFLTILLGSLILVGAGCIQFGSTAKGPSGLYRSGDKGETWQQIAAFPTTQGVKSIGAIKVFRIYTDPSDPDALYMGSRGQGLYYSFNKGDSWQSAPPLNGKFIYGFAVDPRDKCAIYVADGQSIYKTNDCLRTWRTVFTEGRTGERFISLAIDFGNSNIVYGAELGGDVIRSLDAGQSWSTVGRLGVQLRNMIADPREPGRVYVASYRDGLRRSDDRGNSWVDAGNGLQNFSEATDFYRLIINPAQANSIFWISKYGILRSDDAGSSWSAMTLLTPPGSVNIYSFAVNPKNQREMYYTGTILNEKGENLRSTFYKSTDGGATWVTKRLPTNTIPVDMLVHRENGNMVILGFTSAE